MVFDKELLSIVTLSLEVSLLAIALATLIGVPLGVCLGRCRFPLKSLVVSAANTLMGLPPVVVGLVLYLILSRRGVLGFLSLLYTPAAMVLAQWLLALPIVVALSHSAVAGVDPVIAQAARALGASPFQTSMAVVREARYALSSAVIAAFGRVTAEVGAVFMVGGNIAGHTRVMTTAIAMEVDKGGFELALSLGICAHRHLAA